MNAKELRYVEKINPANSPEQIQKRIEALNGKRRIHTISTHTKIKREDDGQFAIYIKDLLGYMYLHKRVKTASEAVYEECLRRPILAYVIFL